MKFLFLTAALVLSFSTAARDLPSWESLEFEQKAFWVTAHASLHLASAGGKPQRWQLTAISSVANNMEQRTVEFESDSGRVIERERLSRGKNQRLKQYAYTDTGVLRLRKEPEDGATPGDDWSVTSHRELAIPDTALDNPLVDSYALLVLAAEAIDSEKPVRFSVHTDFNFYTVEVLAGKVESVQLARQLHSGETKLDGVRQARAVTLRASGLPGNPDKADFSLLGLGAEITILYDIDTGLPLQLRGRAPRIGNAELNLINMQLRATSS